MTNEIVEVLLVEDNLDEARLALRALKKNNLANQIIHLEDGQEALDFIFAKGQFSDRKMKQLPKVIILDLKMPRVDGFEVIKAIRADQRTKLIPIVVMTSSAHNKDILASYDLGVNAFVVKPLDFDKFHEAMVKVGMFWLMVNNPPS